MLLNKNFVVNGENAKEYISKMGAFVKNNIEEANNDGAVLGMSGGIDCSVVARICQVSNIKIKLIILPDGENENTNKSINDALELINKFKFEYKIINIKPICDSIESAICENLEKSAKINIRPRVRMTILYSIAQNNNCFVLGTGNLDERILGYFTKWGDGGHDINPLGMLTKREVRILARHLDIPERIIVKPPSAGLFDGQTDEEELGLTYEQIDDFILNGTSGNTEIDNKINIKIEKAKHKLFPIKIFTGE